MGGLRHQVVVVLMLTATAAALAVLLLASAASAIKAANPTRQLNGSGNPSNSETAQTRWFSVWAALISRSSSSRVRRGTVGERESVHSGAEEAAAGELVVTRRRLIGPGSSPPTCRSKCGSCSPCVAVHVPIHPGLGMPLEYYPEAWRCKCGNKLYMP
ncbi:hypothetical protein Ancab_030335 [Ancistrocladus abbreviatus]